MSNTILQKNVRLSVEASEREYENEMPDIEPSGLVAEC